MTKRKYLRPGEAAKRLGFHRTTINNWVAKELILPAPRWNATHMEWMIPVAFVEMYLREYGHGQRRHKSE